SVPVFSSRACDFENYGGDRFSTNQTEYSENSDTNFNNSSYLGTSYTDSSYYTDSTHTHTDDDDDDDRTVSGLTISTEDSNARLYLDTGSSIYDEFPGISSYPEDTDDLPDLPLRRDYGGVTTESESEM
ncbi:18442_t:CDS:1, partial [Acaulospora morrowiae]